MSWHITYVDRNPNSRALWERAAHRGASFRLRVNLNGIVATNAFSRPWDWLTTRPKYSVIDISDAEGEALHMLAHHLPGDRWVSYVKRKYS